MPNHNALNWSICRLQAYFFLLVGWTSINLAPRTIFHDKVVHVVVLSFDIEDSNEVVIVIARLLEWELSVLGLSDRLVWVGQSFLQTRSQVVNILHCLNYFITYRFY